MAHSSKDFNGSVYILISALMYATLPVLVKLAYAHGLTPGNALFLRYLFSFLMLAVLLKGIRRERVLTVSPLVAAQGVFLTAGGLLYFLALQFLPAGLTTVIFFVHPVLVAILSILIYREPFMPRVFLGLALALTGVYLLAGYNDSALTSSPGITYALLSCLCYALYSLIGQKTLADGEPLSITATLSLVAVIMIAPLYPSDTGVILHLTWQQLLITLMMAGFNTLMAVLFFLKGLQQIGATRATLLSTTEPAFCIILAYLILGETLAMREIAGAVLIFASMFLALRRMGDIPVDSLADNLKHP